MALYHAWVWTGAALSGVYASAHAGYRSAYHICWTNARPGSPLRNLDNWVLFLGWVVAYASLGVAALLYGQSRLLFGGASLAHRLAPRLQQLRASRLYTLVFPRTGRSSDRVHLHVRYEVQGWLQARDTSPLPRLGRYRRLRVVGRPGDGAAGRSAPSAARSAAAPAQRSLPTTTTPRAARAATAASTLRRCARASTISGGTLFGPARRRRRRLAVAPRAPRRPRPPRGARETTGWRAWRARVEADVRATAGDEICRPVGRSAPRLCALHDPQSRHRRAR